MHENELSKIILDCAFSIHAELGPGLFESVYEEILTHELQNSGSFVQRQHPIPVLWDELKMEIGFRADLIVENKSHYRDQIYRYVIPGTSQTITDLFKDKQLKTGVTDQF